jgi:hypothetical protein
MKKYYLTVIGAKTSWDVVVEANYLSANETGQYSFYYHSDELVACYPINRTIITKIEHNNEQ